eukprot:gene12956-17253_t
MLGLLLAAVLAGVAGMAAAGPAAAQGKLEARYEASLAGIPVGKGAWTIEIADDQYNASASGGTSGLLKAFAGGAGAKSETINMVLAGGGVKEFSIEPEPPVDPERIPVTDAHRRGVIDPMTGSLLRVPGNGELLAAESCRTATAIFDGRMRYELKLDYKRMDTVKAEKGYRGPVVVCAVYFTPIAGHIPDRAAIKYLAAQRNIEVWLAPIAGTRVLVPFRMTVPTPLGTAMLEAVDFVTTATPPRLANSVGGGGCAIRAQSGWRPVAAA